MTKKIIHVHSYLYPMPVIIVGANVRGKANFLTIAYCGIIRDKPPTIAISASKGHYTNKGIRENHTFSVNTPSVEMVEKTDYIGIESGKDVDKSKIFDVFYGELQTAPMISEAPLNLECKLVKNVDLGGGNDIFFGEIVQTYANENCLTDDLPDIEKIDPLVFSMTDNSYRKVGEFIGKAWEIGHNYKKKQKIK